MRKLFLALAFVLVCVPARAQDIPRVEIFGGYSYLHREDVDLNPGWNLAVDWSFGKTFMAVLDESAQYGTLHGQSVRQFWVSAGPAAAFGRDKRAAVFVHVFAGLIRSIAVVEREGDSVSVQENDFGTMFGGGTDIKMSRKFAFRLQGDYEIVFAQDGNQTGYRLSAGIVFRMGMGK